MSDGNVRGRLGYQPALDGLRAVACVVVVIHHCDVFDLGFYGVDVFFVLSGFLITSLLLEERAAAGTISLRGFYLRRVARIFPALWAVVAVTVAWAQFPSLIPDDYPIENVRASAVSTLLFYSNWLDISHFDPICMTWSLSVEEHFYLAWPLLFLVATRAGRPGRVLLGITVAGLVLAPLDRVLISHIHSHDGYQAAFTRIYYGSDTRADCLLYGCLAAQAFHFYPGHCARLGRFLAWSGLVMVAAILSQLTLCEPAHPLSFTATSLGSALLVLGLTASTKPTWLAMLLSTRLFRFMGKVSYGAYLWHRVGMLITGHVVSDHVFNFPETTSGQWMFACTAVLLAVALGTASHYLVERPVLALKKRLFDGPKKAPRAVGPIAVPSVDRAA